MMLAHLRQGSGFQSQHSSMKTPNPLECTPSNQNSANGVCVGQTTIEVEIDGDSQDPRALTAHKNRVQLLDFQNSGEDGDTIGDNSDARSEQLKGASSQ
mmetsp:Transcript_15932/g.21604  ORF Transcript_15932/g.21604 Transcript_15932/m.21604 type:complete len:99 (+) Transcript_15932:904-1200(+)